MAKQVNPVYTFYPENKISNECKLFLSDIRQVFQKWLLTRDIDWIKYYGCSIVVQTFITDKSGLNSPFENSQLINLERQLKPDYENIINGINPVSKTPMHTAS